VLKSDSSLLTNRKPLFVPEWCNELCALPCWVLRVSRLGRSIAPKFAERYYDAVAAGLDFYAADKLQEALAGGEPWTQAIAFEGSLAVGQWEPVEHICCPLQPQPQPGDGQHRWLIERNGEAIEQTAWDNVGLKEVFSQAIARISELVTIRQGDLIYVAHPYARMHLQAEDKTQCIYNGDEMLMCRIK